MSDRIPQMMLPCWLLFAYVPMTLWWAPMLLILSAINNGGTPSAFSSGGATAIALLWGMTKLRQLSERSVDSESTKANPLKDRV